MLGQGIGQGLVSDMQLQQYVDQVMLRYDSNRSGTLEAGELSNFFNELFTMCGYPTRVNVMQATQMMRQMDSNFDGRANKFELFRAFKQMISSSNSMGNMGGGGYNNSWNPGYQGSSGMGMGMGMGTGMGTGMMGNIATGGNMGMGGGYGGNMGGGFGGNNGW